ncbi:hypothetical protein CALCODRAFT_510528 [Calocera cornea HHB12733]|uniref:Uncharacterized protein n=1 Tax=Calocera cornea HHB12733 TaxID=1353952 RepID=A0A165EG22_9BASI|nr:hypothetical protein CALCODRAFT_510528 [Calocera cornea HHB12733]
MVTKPYRGSIFSGEVIIGVTANTLTLLATNSSSTGQARFVLNRSFFDEFDTVATQLDGNEAHQYMTDMEVVGTLQPKQLWSMIHHPLNTQGVAHISLAFQDPSCPQVEVEEPEVEEDGDEEGREDEDDESTDEEEEEEASIETKVVLTVTNLMGIRWIHQLRIFNEEGEARRCIEPDEEAAPYVLNFDPMHGADIYKHTLRVFRAPDASVEWTCTEEKLLLDFRGGRGDVGRQVDISWDDLNSGDAVRRNAEEGLGVHMREFHKWFMTIGLATSKQDALKPIRWRSVEQPVTASKRERSPSTARDSPRKKRRDTRIDQENNTSAREQAIEGLDTGEESEVRTSAGKDAMPPRGYLVEIPPTGYNDAASVSSTYMSALDRPTPMRAEDDQLIGWDYDPGALASGREGGRMPHELQPELSSPYDSAARDDNGADAEWLLGLDLEPDGVLQGEPDTGEVEREYDVVDYY